MIRVLDPHEYSSVGLGMWWALQTVTTVGYGDATAAITSTFVARATSVPPLRMRPRRRKRRSSGPTHCSAAVLCRVATGVAVLSQNDGVVGTRWGTGRIEAFSDGVFAIAITLLILEIGVPEAAFDNLWRGIVDQWPSYLAYATSFLTIGGIWLAHHGIFRRLQYANQRVMLINLLLLMAVSFLPFPTKLMAEAIHDTSAERAAVIFYGGSLLVISLLVGALGHRSHATAISSGQRWAKRRSTRS